MRVESCWTGKALELDEQDRQLIGESWRKIGDHALWAQRLFAKLFICCPPLAKAMSMSQLCGKDLLNNVRFRDFCHRFAEFWRNLIALLCDSDREEDWLKAVESIRLLGQRHSQNSKVTFEAPVWLRMKNEIVLSITGFSDIRRDRVCLSWNRLLMFTIAEMKHAFNEGVRRRSSPFLRSNTYHFEQAIHGHSFACQTDSPAAPHMDNVDQSNDAE
ncbi:Globin family protein [Trichuris trichiura]|uniref:Globin family protein n=1 Tax=Trichuris trichiura TaxID=36087 RepID=A0A077ZC87_TRITR|nr:Globin family protein [Trichuris trichiura]